MTGNVEQEAKNMGWVPQEQFRGNPDNWIPADEFVEKGQHVMPLLLANNKRLQGELLTRDAKIGTLESQVSAAVTAIDKLEKHYTAANQRLVADQKRALTERLKSAREDNDTDAEQATLDALDEVRDRERVAKAEAEKPPVKKDEPAGDYVSPDFKAWNEDNTWYGQDKKKTKEVIRIAEDLREEGNTLTGRAFMDAAVEAWEAAHGNNEEENETPTPRQNKVESGNNSSNARGSGKTFNSLPAEAKRACHEDTETLVGEGKRYKTVGDWEKAYAKIYYGEG